MRATRARAVWWPRTRPRTRPRTPTNSTARTRSRTRWPGTPGLTAAAPALRRLRVTWSTTRTAPASARCGAGWPMGGPVNATEPAGPDGPGGSDDSRVVPVISKAALFIVGGAGQTGRDPDGRARRRTAASVPGRTAPASRRSRYRPGGTHARAGVASIGGDGPGSRRLSIIDADRPARRSVRQPRRYGKTMSQETEKAILAG